MISALTNTFEVFAQYCKAVEGVTVVYDHNLYDNTVCIKLSKDGYYIREIITNHVIDNNLHIHVLQQTLEKLKKHLNIQPIHISGAKLGSIVMDEIATTTQKFSDNDIARIGDLKRRAKNLITQMLRVQDPFFGMINKDKFVLAGGCFTSWYHGESPKDHDVFILGCNGTKLRPDQWSQMSDDRYEFGDANYLNAMNHKAKIVDVVLDKKTNVQYIMTQYKTREELIKHFDVEHACVSYTPADDKLYINPLAFDCIKNKKLMAHDGNISHWRKHKFGLKGFTVETVSV